MISVLHISDLHRDPSSTLKNAALRESLLRDADRYHNHGVRPPDLIIASGDIVQGVSPKDAAADTKLRDQYGEADAFLKSLAREFLHGDHQRIVLIPGHHDVHYPRALASFEELDASTTTIITKNRIVVPVPDQLSSTFTPTEGFKEFYVRFDTLVG